MRPYSNSCPCDNKWLSGFIWGRGARANAYTVRIGVEGISSDMLMKLRNTLQQEGFETKDETNEQGEGTAHSLKITHPEVKSWTLPPFRIRTLGEEVPEEFLCGLLDAIQEPCPDGLLVAGWNWMTDLPRILRKHGYNFIGGSGQLTIIDAQLPPLKTKEMMPSAAKTNRDATSSHLQITSKTNWTIPPEFHIAEVPSATIWHLKEKGKKSTMLSSEEYAVLTTYAKTIYSHKWPLEELKMRAESVLKSAISSGILDFPCSSGSAPCSRCRELMQKLWRGRAKITTPTKEVLAKTTDVAKELNRGEGEVTTGSTEIGELTESRVVSRQPDDERDGQRSPGMRTAGEEHGLRSPTISPDAEIQAIKGRLQTLLLEKPMMEEDLLHGLSSSARGPIQELLKDTPQISRHLAYFQKKIFTVYYANAGSKTLRFCAVCNYSPRKIGPFCSDRCEKTFLRDSLAIRSTINTTARGISKRIETLTAQPSSGSERIIERISGSMIWHIGAKARKHNVLCRDECDLVISYGRNIWSRTSNPRGSDKTVEMLVRKAIEKKVLDYPCRHNKSKGPCAKCRELSDLWASRPTNRRFPS